MEYQQLQQELFDPSSILCALMKGKDAFFSALEESNTYRKNHPEEDLSKQLISTAEHLARSYDLNNIVPEKYRPFVRMILSRPFGETIDFVSVMAKKYGEGKTTEQALREITLGLVKAKIFGR